MSEKIQVKNVQPILAQAVPTPDDLANRMRVLKFPVISGYVRSFSVEPQKWSRQGNWKIDMVFYVDQNCEDKVHGSDGLRRAMIFLTMNSVK